MRSIHRMGKAEPVAQVGASTGGQQREGPTRKETQEALGVSALARASGSLRAEKLSGVLEPADNAGMGAGPRCGWSRSNEGVCGDRAGRTRRRQEVPHRAAEQAQPPCTNSPLLWAPNPTGEHALRGACLRRWGVWEERLRL